MTYRIEAKEETGLFEVAHHETFETVEEAIAFVRNWYGETFEEAGIEVRIVNPEEDITVWSNR